MAPPVRCLSSESAGWIPFQELEQCYGRVWNGLALSLDNGTSTGAFSDLELPKHVEFADHGGPWERSHDEGLY